MQKQGLHTRLKTFLSTHHPSAFLLAAQLVLLVLYAVFAGRHSERAIISTFGTLVLILVVWGVTRTPAVNWIAWVLAVPAFVLNLLTITNLDSDLIATSALFDGILYIYAAGSMIAYMMGDAHVTVDELFAAGATFTLLAWGFAYFYMVCQVWVPGSFASSTNPGGALTFLELLFLSFTNLSATGLSDISPISAPARVLAMLEQFMGVGYVAMVVSRLVGLTTSMKPHQG